MYATRPIGTTMSHGPSRASPDPPRSVPSRIASSAGARAVPSSLVAVAALCCGAAWVFAGHLRRRLGGYTGDTLGAVQQGTELLVYIVLAWRGG